MDANEVETAVKTILRLNQITERQAQQIQDLRAALRPFVSAYANVMRHDEAKWCLALDYISQADFENACEALKDPAHD